MASQADPTPPFVVTLDIGSSSTRALMFDATGAPIPGVEAQAKYELRTTADGGSELDADRMLLRVAICLDELLHEAGPYAAQIGAVALDTFVSNVLGVDQDGAAVTPVYTWADTRAAPWARRLRQQLDQPAVWERTGCPLHSSYLPARFAWLAAECPDLFRSARRWMSIGEYLVLRLSGACQVSTSIASWSGLLNRQQLAWDAELLAALPVTIEQLSELVDARQPWQGLQKEYAVRWPALSKVPWFHAVGDGVGSNLGCGAATPERVGINLGTSGAMRIVTPAGATRPEGLWCYRVDAERELLGGSISNAGNVFAWLQETLQLPDLELFEAQLAEAIPAAHGLTVLPFLAGERSPGYADPARATIGGLSLHTHAVDLAQAMLESVAYTIDSVYRRLWTTLPERHEIIASGGAILHSPAWQQILCDVLGRPLTISSVEQATARGVALLALQSLGAIADPGALPVPTARVLEPNGERHALHQEAAERQTLLYATLVAPTG